VDDVAFLYFYRQSTMKKLLAAGCTILALQSFSQIAPMNDPADLLNGRKVLIKAIAVIVNSENNRKIPPKRIHIPNLESPRI
jgi:hypothetical protein